MSNDHLLLIGGESGSGKSVSLRNLKGNVMYLNCEAGKQLPFKNSFKRATITDPLQVLTAFDQANEVGGFDYIVIDTLTFLMDMFESKYVIGSANTMEGWQNYQQFFKTLMQEKVAKAQQNVIILAHTRSDLDESSMSYKTSVPIKGALKNQGIEAYFSTVVSCKKVELKDLEDYQNDLLTITPEEEMLGFKHCFQTRLTKQTTGERIRAPMDMWTLPQTFVNNDAGLVMSHLIDYYK